MNVEVAVGAVRSRVDPVPASSRAALLERFTIPVPGARFARRSRPGWDGKIRYFAADGSFLTGFLPAVAEILEAGGHRLSYRDDRPPVRPRRLGRCLVGLRDYQVAVVDEVLAGGVRCTVKAATNSGKTEAAIVVAHRLGVRTLFLAPGVDLAAQTRDRFARALPEARVGLLTGARGTVSVDDTDEADVVVANVQGLSARTRGRQRAFVRDRGRGHVMGHDPRAEGGRAWKLGPFTREGLGFLETFDLVIGDEVETLTPAEHGKILDACPARHRLGLSATPDTGDPCRDALRVGHFGEVVAEVSQAFLRDAGHSSPVTVVLLGYVPGRPIATADWQAQRAEGIVGAAARNVAIADAVVVDARRGLRVMVVVDLYDHADRIGRLLSLAGVRWRFVSGANRADRAEALDDFRAGRVPVIVATSVFNRGIDLKEIDRLAIAAGGASANLATQRGGRLVRFREGKEAVLYLPRDAGLYAPSVRPEKRFLERHFRTTLAALRAEGFAVVGDA